MWRTEDPERTPEFPETVKYTPTGTNTRAWNDGAISNSDSTFERHIPGVNRSKGKTVVHIVRFMKILTTASVHLVWGI
jgi:hypothetical protein